MNENFVIKDGLLEAYKGTSFDVVIPQGVITIGKKAFTGNTYVKNVITNEDLENIDDFAFSNCESLREIKLCEKVKRIGYAAFEGCPRLTKINIPDSLEEIGTGAFDLLAPISDKKVLSKIWEIEEATEDRMNNLALPMLKLISKEFRGSGIEFEAYPAGDKINVDLTDSDVFEYLELPFILDPENDERTSKALEDLRKFVERAKIMNS